MEGIIHQLEEDTNVMGDGRKNSGEDGGAIKVPDGDLHGVSTGSTSIWE